MAVYRELEARIGARGGRIRHCEVVGMLPDRLLLEAAAERLSLIEPAPARLLSRRLAEHLATRTIE